jgi:murein DD-endopeptidase MepM/ murein hydrolase activator NlpD
MLTIGAIISLFSFCALLLAFVGIMSNPYRVHSQLTSYRQQVSELKQQNQQLNQWKQTVSGLDNELKKTRKQHVALLNLTGFTSLTELEKNQSDSGTLNSISPEKMAEIKEILNGATTRNKQLARVQDFVKNRNEVLNQTPMLWPTEGWVSSPYGYRQNPMGGRGRSHHDGIDIAAWHGTPVRATASGKVVFTGWNGGYGKMVRVKHKFGYETLYAHLSKIKVKQGQVIKKGTVVGNIGSTGRATGSHLHYEVRVNGKAINPEPYMVEKYDILAKLNKQED